MKWTNAFIFLAVLATGAFARLASAQPLPASQLVAVVDPAAAGRVLLGEMNCAACHAPSDAQAKWVTPKAAPKLTEIGNRASAAWLMRYLASPHEAKPGTTMPNVLAAKQPAERAVAAAALTHFLLSQSPLKHKPILPDRAAVARGETLYHTVGCVACHAPQNVSAPRAGALPADSVPLPVMSEKYAFDGLRRFLRDPLAVRHSGRMPSLNLTDAEAGDLAHYLLRDTRVPAAVELTQFRGRPRSLEDFDAAEMSRTVAHEGLTLGPLARDRGFSIRLSTWLRVDQAGDYTFHLSAAGASRLGMNGTWLIQPANARAERVEAKATVRLDVGLHALLVDFQQRGPKEPALKVEWEGPGVAREQVPTSRLSATRDPVPEPKLFIVDREKAAAGKALYAALNCAACHDAKPHAASAVAPMVLPSLSVLKPDRGCLADAPPANAMQYRLAGDQRSALRAGLASIASPDVPNPSPQQQLAHTLTTMRCVQCHTRDGVGKPPADRDAFFTSAGEDLGDEGRVPPRLTGIGDKLRPEAITTILAGAPGVRPYVNTRMPNFGEANVHHLPALFVAIDRKPVAFPPAAVADAPDVQRDAGRKLAGTDGLSCVACHRFNRQPAQTMQIVDLTTVTSRLNEDWFRQFLVDPNRFHPGTRMPSLWPDGRSLLPAVLEGDTNRQHAALWTYLADGDRAKFPAGLGRQNVELVVGGEAVVYRGKLWEAGYRAVAVGHPGGVNVAFDAEEMRLALLWRGRFLNAGPHWNVQGMGQIRPLGADTVVFPRGAPMAVLADATTPWPKESSRELGMRFGGYQLDALLRPTLLYSFKNIGVSDRIIPTEVPGGTTVLRRTITFDAAPPAGLHLRLAVGALKPAGTNAWRLNEAMTIRVTAGGKPIVRGEGDQGELLIPVTLDGKPGAIEVDYAW